MEVVSENGEIVNDVNLVLGRSVSDFSALYNRPRGQGPDNTCIPNIEIGQNINFTDTGMNEHISIFEVKTAVQDAK